MEKKRNQNKERNTLQLINTYRSALMGFAAIMVLLHHYWAPVSPEGSIIRRIENYIHYTGFIGVDIFLLLSGMGLYYAIQKHDIKTFYKRRFSRILPVILTSAIIMALVDGWSLGQFICNITGINFYLKETFSFLWYAVAIIQLYLIFPLYYKFFNKAKNKKKFTTLAILVWLICTLVFGDVSRSDMFVFTNRIPVFLIGVLFGWMERNEEIEFTKYHNGICIITLLIGLFLEFVVILFGTWATLHIYGTGFPALLVAIPLVLLLPQLFELMTTHLRKVGQSIIKLFSLVGGVSFELYVVQEWIGNKVNLVLGDNCSNLVTNIVDWLTIVLACVVLVLASKLINKLFSKKGVR